MHGVLEARRHRIALPMHFVDCVRIERRQLPREDRNQDHDEQDDGPGHCHLVPAETLPNRNLREDGIVGNRWSRGLVHRHYAYFTRGSSHAYKTSASRLKNTTKNALMIR